MAEISHATLEKSDGQVGNFAKIVTAASGADGGVA
jgi:hypothetical protein